VGIDVGIIQPNGRISPRPSVPCTTEQLGVARSRPEVELLGPADR
jgi:hypothetical protein